MSTLNFKTYNEGQFDKNERSKHVRKVSKYRDKNGNIKKEMIECIRYIDDSVKLNIEYIQKYCLRELNEFFYRSKSKKINHKCNDLEKGSYTKCMVNKAYRTNKFYIRKDIKQDSGAWVYEKMDMYKFLLSLCYAIKHKELNQFIDIPDVFYILRQLKSTGIEYYLAA